MLCIKNVKTSSAQKIQEKRDSFCWFHSWWVYEASTHFWLFPGLCHFSSMHRSQGELSSGELIKGSISFPFSLSDRLQAQKMGHWAKRENAFNDPQNASSRLLDLCPKIPWQHSCNERTLADMTGSAPDDPYNLYTILLIELFLDMSLIVSQKSTKPVFRNNSSDRSQMQSTSMPPFCCSDNWKCG